MIEAYVANLALLNVGRSMPEPLSLPADFETAQALFKRLDLADGNHDMVITEYHSDIPGLTKCLSQYDNLDELNYLATLLDSLDEADREKFAAAVSYGDYADNVKDLINLVQNLDCYEYYPGITTEEELGYFLIDELQELEISEEVAGYFDYEAYGRDVHLNGGAFTRDGYIESGAADFTEHYNGRDIPAEYRLLARPEPSPPERRESTVEKSGTKSAPIMDNPHVQELLSIMEANNVTGTRDFLSMLGQVGAMEQQLDKAVSELTAMRRELETLREESHPVKTALQNGIKALEKSVGAMRQRLDAVRDGIIGGCKNAVSAFREQGLSALRNVADFFHIRPGLEALQNSMDKGIRYCEAEVAKVEKISAEYHEAGRHLENIGRALAGKEAVTEAKAPGKVAKAIEAPMKAERACLLAARRSVTAAIGALGRLEKTERKEPIMETVQKLNAQIAQAKKDAPAQVRPRPISHDGR